MRNLLMICGMVIILSSCYNDKADRLYVTPVNTTCDTNTVTYSATINPILVNNCATVGCHTPNPGAAIYDLTNYNDVLLSINARPPQNMMNAIQHTGGVSPMPKSGGSLSSCQISQILSWINKGAPNN